nr:MAG TPA: hypothetical protein [Caudoviricetes sp.]
MPFLNRLEVDIILFRISKFSTPVDKVSNISFAVCCHTKLTGTHLYVPLDSIYF